MNDDLWDRVRGYFGYYTGLIGVSKKVLNTRKLHIVRIDLLRIWTGFPMEEVKGLPQSANAIVVK